MGFGNIIKSLRIERKLSQKQLGDLTKLNQATISRIEKNKFKPGADALCELADVFQVPIDYLLDTEKNIKPAELVAMDEIANDIIRTYKNLSLKGRFELLNYSKYLEKKPEFKILTNKKRK